MTSKKDIIEANRKYNEKNYDKIIEVTDMMCKNCRNHVLEAINSIEGVHVDVSLFENKVFIKGNASDDALKEVIEEVDNEAFILITDAQEVIGKGFTTPVVPTPIENLVKECKDNAHYVEHKD